LQVEIFLAAELKEEEEGGSGKSSWERLEEAAMRVLAKAREGSVVTPALLEGLDLWLPGPVTQQKLLGLDGGVDSRFAAIVYPRLLSHLMDFTKVIPREVFDKLFVIESGDSIMFGESLIALVEAFDRCDGGPSSKLDLTVELITRLVQSEALVTSILDICSQKQSTNPVLRTSLTDSWSQIVRLLISLPPKLANKLKGNFPDTFIPEKFSQWLIGHCGKAVSLLYLMKRHGVTISTEPLALLLGKIFLHFRDSRATKQLIKVFDSWCSEREGFSKLASQLFSEMEQNCIESAAILVLQDSTNNVNKLLGDIVLTSDAWKFVLCKKIPFLTFNSNDMIIKNLIKYLHAVEQDSPNDGILTKMTIELLQVWSDKSALNHTVYEQHKYLTEIIVLSVTCLAKGMSEETKSSIKNVLLSGIPVHLESTIGNIRAIGMITAEIIINLLDDCAEGESTLQFNYSGMNPSQATVVSYFRELKEFKYMQEIKGGKCGDDLLEELLGMNVKTEMPQKVEKKVSLVKEMEKVTLKAEEKKPLIEDLDSDDEFEPFDVSNDVKSSVKKRPKYLRDLIEGLLESTDVEIWVGSMEVCQGLVESQLAQDDLSIGLELLGLMIEMDKKFYIEGFDELRFNGALSVLLVYPGPCAEYLAREFHAEVGKYSVAHKLFMLELLSSGARSLSNPVVEKQKESKWEDVVRQHIVGKTRKIVSPTVVKIGSENKFAQVAGSFLFPLLRGVTQKSAQIWTDFSREELVLLLYNLLRTTAVIMASSVNCPIAPRMGREVLEMSWSLRFHEELKIREAVISCVASVVLALPKSRLEDEMWDELLEARLWLIEIADSIMSDMEIRAFAAQAVMFIDSHLGFNDNDKS
jgi:telomere length regulation protein